MARRCLFGRLGDFVLQLPVASEPGRRVPGPVSDVDLPVGHRGGDALRPLDAARLQVPSQHRPEGDAITIHACVDLRPLRLRRCAEYVTDPKVLDELTEPLRAEKLVLWDGDACLADVLQGSRLPDQLA